MRKLLLILIIVGFSCFQKVSAYSGDSLMIDQLVMEIASMQYTREGTYQFHPGMFYSYKKWAGFSQRNTPDNNIFYTGLVAFTMQNMLPNLSSHNKKMVDLLISRAISAYPLYQNKQGLPSYFFWQGGKPIMPNTRFVHKLSNQIATSEDIDDSVILLMTMETSDSTVKKLKLIMDTIANTRLRTIKNTYKKYKFIPAHSTYLGKKMRVDFDFAVHCNVLYFLKEKKLPFNKYDSATLELVKEIIQAREYIKDPKYISPYYINTPVILYHLARLMGKFTLPSLESYRKQIVLDLQTALQKSSNIMDDIILSTSLLRMGEKAPPLPINNLDVFNNSNQDSFVFYQARAASQMDNPFKRLLLNFNMLNYNFFCPAYNKVLLLEYLVERGKNTS